MIFILIAFVSDISVFRGSAGRGPRVPLLLENGTLGSKAENGTLGRVSETQAALEEHPSVHCGAVIQVKQRIQFHSLKHRETQFRCAIVEEARDGAHAERAVRASGHRYEDGVRNWI